MYVMLIPRCSGIPKRDGATFIASLQSSLDAPVYLLALNITSRNLQDPCNNTAHTYNHAPLLVCVGA
jgi:hypothetical protein